MEVKGKMCFLRLSECAGLVDVCAHVERWPDLGLNASHISSPSLFLSICLARGSPAVQGF